MNAYERRFCRAQAIQARGGYIRKVGGTWHVKSGATHDVYDVAIQVDSLNAWLVGAQCTCPDYEWLLQESREHPRNDSSMIDGTPVCKHVLAVLIEEGWLDPAKGN